MHRPPSDGWVPPQFSSQFAPPPSGMSPYTVSSEPPWHEMDGWMGRGGTEMMHVMGVSGWSTPHLMGSFPGRGRQTTHPSANQENLDHPAGEERRPPPTPPYGGPRPFHAPPHPDQPYDHPYSFHHPTAFTFAGSIQSPFPIPGTVGPGWPIFGLGRGPAHFAAVGYNGPGLFYPPHPFNRHPTMRPSASYAHPQPHPCLRVGLPPSSASPQRPHSFPHSPGPGHSPHRTQSFPRPHHPPPPPHIPPFRPVSATEAALHSALMMLARTNAINFQTQAMVVELLMERTRSGGQGGQGGRWHSWEGDRERERRMDDDPIVEEIPDSPVQPSRPLLLIANKRHHESDDSDDSDESEAVPLEQSTKRSRGDTMPAVDEIAVPGKDSQVVESDEESDGTALPETVVPHQGHAGCSSNAHEPVNHGATVPPTPSAIRSHPSVPSPTPPSALSPTPTPTPTPIDPSPRPPADETLDRLLSVLGLTAEELVALANDGKMEDWLESSR